MQNLKKIELKKKKKSNKQRRRSKKHSNERIMKCGANWRTWSFL